jgi:hypothetical protein
MILPGAFPSGDSGNAIDVSGDEMTIETAIGAERPFQVYERTRGGELKIGALPRFAKQVELETLPPAAPDDPDHRQATAVHGQAVADFEALRTGTRFQREANGVFRGLDLSNDARFFNDAGEHAELALSKGALTLLQRGPCPRAPLGRFEQTRCLRCGLSNNKHVR